MPRCLDCGKLQHKRCTINPTSEICIKISNITINESADNNNNVPTTSEGMNGYFDTRITVSPNNRVVNNDTAPISGLSAGNWMCIIDNALTDTFKSFEEEIEQTIDSKIGMVSKDLTDRLSLLEDRLKSLESDDEKKKDESGKKVEKN